MTYHDFDDLTGDSTPAQQARVEALNDEARAEIVTYNLKEAAPTPPDFPQDSPSSNWPRLLRRGAVPN